MSTVNLDRLLKPRSVAVLGASERRSIGRSVIRSLDCLGYDGEILPVNPKYDGLLDRPCYPSLHALPTPPDVVVFCISRDRTLDSFRMLPGCGAGAAVIYGGGYGEGGEEGRALQDEITAICRDAGIALMGPNCMGGMSPWHRCSTYMAEIAHPERLAGNVGLVSQSGSVTLGMLVDLRRFGFSYLVSSGNEAVVTAADYVDYLVDDPRTRVIALFLESARSPERFVAALDRARDAGKPVVVLKVGRSERAVRSVTSHTGALAGRAEVFSEVLRTHGAIEVRELEEMAEVLCACQGEHLPAGPRIAVVTASGGQAELILDIAADEGLDLPPPLPEARSAIEEVTGPLTGDGNPTDAWGSGDFSVNLDRALTVLSETEGYDALGLCMDTGDFDIFAQRVVRDATEIVANSGRSTGLPHFVLGTRVGQMTAEQLSILRDAGQVFLTGIRPGLKALDRLGRWSAPLGAERAAIPMPEAVQHPAWGDVERRPSINEHDAKTLLAGAALPVVRETAVDRLDAALEAAEEIGYPVVLKACADHIAHKSDLGLVHVGIAGETALEASWDRIQASLARSSTQSGATGILVQEMVTGGLEVFAGVSRDPQFGLTIAFGLGGILVEVLQDFALRLLPLREGDAEAMIREIRGYALLEGVRGAGPFDTAALADCLYGLSDFTMANATRIQEIDVNPIIVLPRGEGCRVVDALIVPSRPA